MEIRTGNPPQEEEKIRQVLAVFDSIMVPRISQRVNLQEYAKKLAQNAVWFLAYDKENVAGHCAVYMNQKDCAFISSIAVKPQMQGRGIGSGLWNCVEKEAEVRKIHKITLKVLKENAQAIRFYKQQGCEILSEAAGWLLMEKELLG